jgi:sec-independent protein translocase protein TatB
MFPEVGATELLVIGVIALIVIGPKDLPIMMRKLGQFLARMRGMAAEFRASFDELARQSELDELRREVEAMRAAAQQPAAYVSQSIGLDHAQAEISAHLADRLHPAEAAEAANPGPNPEPEQEPEPASAAAEPATKPKKRAPRKARSGAKP